MTMGKRLSKIYTRTGDAGETGLGDGSRVAKSHARVEAIGAVDELNSVVGMLVEALIQTGGQAGGQESRAALLALAGILRETQHRLFDLGGELSIPGHRILGDPHVKGLEAALDALNTGLPALDNFILPGGSPLIALCHQARAVCRRAERRIAALAADEPVNPAALAYANRLSDYLFVAARSCARLTGKAEVLWQQG